LPLALIVREVIAVDPSPTMLAGLRAGMAEHGIDNIRVVEGRWPLPPADSGAPPADIAADVALIAHVGYDVEAIGPFLDARQAALRGRPMARPDASVGLTGAPSLEVNLATWRPA